MYPFFSKRIDRRFLLVTTAIRYILTLDTLRLASGECLPSLVDRIYYRNKSQRDVELSARKCGIYFVMVNSRHSYTWIQRIEIFRSNPTL